eukprot:scaffold183_cov249-Pinguiococcus_pyrenoidosus.AAC.5
MLQGPHKVVNHPFGHEDVVVGEDDVVVGVSCYCEFVGQIPRMCQAFGLRLLNDLIPELFHLRRRGILAVVIDDKHIELVRELLNTSKHFLGGIRLIAARNHQQRTWPDHGMGVMLGVQL